MKTLTNHQTNMASKKQYGLGIRGKIFLGFAAIALILIGTNYYIAKRIDITAHFANDIVKSSLPTFDAYMDLDSQVYESKAALGDYVLTNNKQFLQEYISARKIVEQAVQKLDALSPTWNDKKIQADWESLKNVLAAMGTTEAKIMQLDHETDKNKISSLITNELQPQIDQMLNKVDGVLYPDGTRYGGIHDKLYEHWSSAANIAVDNMMAVKKAEYLVLLSYVVFAILIAIITTRTILSPLNNAIHIANLIAEGQRDVTITVTSNDETGKLLTALAAMLQAIKENEIKLQQNETATRTLFDNMVKTANIFSQHSSRVAKGDLTQRISTENTPEMVELGRDLNTMTESLATATHRITEACHNMMSTLAEVKQSIDVQSTGATEQASSINEITASLEEIEKSSAQTITKAKTLGEAAERTREKGQLGLDAVEQSVQGMRSVREKVQTIAQTILALSHQTQQVGDITNVVKTIAQQSKMLALNASIEAAKAGDAGKGFVVVAAEVKSLAEQSEQSTAQVQKILEDIRHATEKAVMATEEGIKGVDEGTALVEQTGGVVRSLTDVIHETTIASEQIAAAIRQEGIGIEQITAGMNEINQVTGAFVASVKQTTAAMEDLTTIAHSLKAYVDIYKI